ncbi:hypothetical protein [Streptomyces hoynatensis]|uniref:Uncharacterized protein n=1 Tax=Streptomyces hoynatensis TaxID=1141874 RepID=A0A3A9YUR0_9ACTN|nr:hypothetical protein [Streptomyces hoynatensis]RKN39284.1 hypothetical protein D7294_22215 [Streptomyces hoynatensis]
MREDEEPHWARAREIFAGGAEAEDDVSLGNLFLLHCLRPNEAEAPRTLDAFLARSPDLRMLSEAANILHRFTEAGMTNAALIAPLHRRLRQEFTARRTPPA